MVITEKEKEILLRAARGSIQSLLFGTPLPAADYKSFPAFRKRYGVFVTITSEGDLRGCIGFISPGKNLFETVLDAAKQAACCDPRFYPVRKEELEHLHIEISILSTLNELKDYNDIIIGRDGLLLDEKARALLLPQVAVEHNYDSEAFLSSLCEKAGLPRDEWKHRKLNLKVFTSTVFSEEKNNE